MSSEEPTIQSSSQRYAVAFRDLVGLTDRHVQMLRAHYHAPHRTITATQLSRAIGYSHYSFANGQYGRLGRLVAKNLAVAPVDEWLGILVAFEKRQGEWHWIMRPEVAKALEMLGWVEGSSILLPEEIAATTCLVEGATCKVLVNSYERNPEARRRCIEHYGVTCSICGFDFATVYGDIGSGYVQVHHLRALAEIAQEYVVDPIEDLRPVCPNCHAMLHRRIPAYTLEEVRAFIRSRPV